MSKSSLVQPGEREIAIFADWLDGRGKKGPTLFDIVRDAKWKPSHKGEETIRYPARDRSGTFEFRGANGGASLKAIIPFKRKRPDSGLRFWLMPSLEVRYRETRCTFSGSYSHMSYFAEVKINGTIDDQDLFSFVDITRANRFLPAFKTQCPYEGLEKIGTDWLFAEGPGQISCALFLLVALLAEKDGEAVLMQPCPDRQDLGCLFKQKLKGMEIDDFGYPKREDGDD